MCLQLRVSLVTGSICAGRFLFIPWFTLYVGHNCHRARLGNQIEMGFKAYMPLLTARYDYEPENPFYPTASRTHGLLVRVPDGVQNLQVRNILEDAGYCGRSIHDHRLYISFGVTITLYHDDAAICLQLARTLPGHGP